MSLQRLWQMSYDSKTLDILRNAKYAVPLIQSFHLFGITLLLGSMVLLNLRLLNLGLTQLPLASVVRQSRRFTIAGLTLAMPTGFLVFVVDPTRYAANYAFRTKMLTLCVALIFQFWVFPRVVAEGKMRPVPVRNILIAGCSLTLWFLVGWAGRAIAFLG